MNRRMYDIGYPEFMLLINLVLFVCLFVCLVGWFVSRSCEGRMVDLSCTEAACGCVTG